MEPEGSDRVRRGRGLYRVPSGGGKASPLTRIDTIRGELSHRFPVMLPDGTRFLYLALSSQEGHQGLYLGSLEDPQMKRRIVRTSANGAIGRGPDGHLYLFFVRDLVLFAQPFDAERGELTGTAAVVGRPIEPAQSVRLAPFTVSERTLVYRPRFRPNTRLIWMDRRGIHGERLGVEGESYRYPSLSPDGTKLAVSRLGRRAGRHDVWWFDLRRGVSERLTADPVGAYVPAWTPDASRVVYSSAREDRWGLYWRPVARRSEESPLLTDQGPPQKYVREVTRDGRFVLFQGVGVDGSHDLWVLPLAEAGTPYRLMETPFAETHGRVSPDGRWLAFTSDETGELQVYVTTFPEPTERWRVSTDGGSDPQWRADGRELYYLAADAMLMAADVGSGATFSAGVPEPLFRMFPDPVSRRFGSVYAAAPDGQRFVVTEIDDDEDEEPRLVVTLNWMAERF